MSAELRLIADPRATYARLRQAQVPIGGLAALRRPALVALVLGASIAMAGTRHAPIALVLSSTILWSILVLAQISIALAFVAAPARRTVGVARALDLFFASHAPWSLWMLAVVAWAPLPGARSLTVVLVAAVVPVVLTFGMIAAHFEHVLGFDRRTAIRRTVLHQAITWSALLGTYAGAVALLPRILQWIQ